EVLLLRLPALARGAVADDAGEAAVPQRRPEGVATLAEEVFRVEGQQGEGAEAAVDQVVRDQAAQRAVVDADPGQPRVVAAGAPFGRGDPRAADHPGDGRAAGPGQDPLALPAPQPGRGLGLEGPGLKVHRPGTLL